MRWILFVAAGTLTATLGIGAQNGAELRGQLSANETERNEGYFSVAQDTAIMVRPGSPLHQWLKEHTGRTVKITIEPGTTE
jgi:hypothetical protein